MHLPRELVDEIISHLPPDDRRSPQNCSLVAKNGYISRERLSIPSTWKKPKPQARGRETFHQRAPRFYCTSTHCIATLWTRTTHFTPPTQVVVDNFRAPSNAGPDRNPFKFLTYPHCSCPGALLFPNQRARHRHQLVHQSLSPRPF